MEQLKRLPVSKQSFENIISNNLLYVDKTDLVWQMANAAEDVVFFARPRRFGKSLLLNTLKAYFEGRKDLFNGLKIMNLENEWKKYEVIKFDFSGIETEKSLRINLQGEINRYKKLYNLDFPNQDINYDFRNLISAIYEKTGNKVVFLCDEYDAPLQHTIFDDKQEHKNLIKVYREFFPVLKTQEYFIRYVFITGITKFTGLSLFSILNNISIVGYYPEYETLCGITQDELTGVLKPYVEQLAKAYNWTFEETIKEIKKNYDGYNFSRKLAGVYNPFSVINCLSKKNIKNYWTASSSNTLLMGAVDEIGWNGETFENIEESKDNLEDNDIDKIDLALYMYQSGYLTIKYADRNIYRLGIPNSEVKQAIYKIIIPRFLKKDVNSVKNNITSMTSNLNNLDIEKVFECMKSLVAGTPYAKGDNSFAVIEDKFRFIVANSLFLCGCQVTQEKQQLLGKPDIVAEHDKCILVIELKMSDKGGLQAAINQINDQKYCDEFLSQHKPVYAVALEFNRKKRGMSNKNIQKIK